MFVPRSILLPSALMGLLAGLAALGSRHGGPHAKPAPRAGPMHTVVSSGADRGPGTLREALYKAAGAPGRATIDIRADTIELKTALPPLVNPHGIDITAGNQHTQIDAHQLGGGPVFDVDAAHSSIVGITIRNCPAAAILVRAGDFRLDSATIESCDVGIDAAENTAGIELQNNQLINDRLGVRFAAARSGMTVVGNRFDGDSGAGIWAVRGVPDPATVPAIAVRGNQFHNNRIGIVAGNLPMVIERNLFTDAQESAIHVIGAGVTVSANHVSRGTSMGIVAENARATVVTNNDLDHLGAYAIFVRGSSGTLIKDNRISSGGYGMAFILGDAAHPNIAVGNLIVDQRYDGIDVLGESPVLRDNRILQAKSMAIRVENFKPPDRAQVIAHPFLDGNVVTAAGAALGAPPQRAATASLP